MTWLAIRWWGWFIARLHVHVYWLRSEKNYKLLRCSLWINHVRVWCLHCAKEWFYLFICDLLLQWCVSGLHFLHLFFLFFISQRSRPNLNVHSKLQLCRYVHCHSASCVLVFSLCVCVCVFVCFWCIAFVFLLLFFKLLLTFLHNIQK